LHKKEDGAKAQMRFTNPPLLQQNWASAGVQDRPRKSFHLENFKTRSWKKITKNENAGGGENKNEARNRSEMQHA